MKFPDFNKFYKETCLLKFTLGMNMKFRAYGPPIICFCLMIILFFPSCSENNFSPGPIKVTPAMGWNAEDTEITVQGINFIASITEDLSKNDDPEVTTSFILLLDNIRLTNIRFSGGNRLTAIVPAFLTPKEYSLTVINPDGSRGTLKNAFNVIDTLTLNIDSITADRPLVSKGQTGIPVSMLVKNPMQVDILVENVALTFDQGTLSSSLASPEMLPVTLGQNDSQLFTFIVEVSPDSAAGLCTIDGLISGNHVGTSTSVSDNSSETTDSWTIQTPGQIAIDAISTDAAAVTQGQSEIDVTMTVSNPGEAEVEIDSAQLTFSQGTYTTDSGLPALPVIIGKDTSQDFSFKVDVASDAQTGLCIIDGNVAGTDTNSGLPTTDDSAATTASWTVQTPAQLTINSISTSYIQVFQGQNGITVTMSVENPGQADAVVESVTLTFSSGTCSSVLSSPSLPVTITGGSTQNFSFIISVDSASAVGQSIIDGNISGKDENSGAVINDDSATTTGSWSMVGSLDHFAFSPISSPQTVGQAFSITMTAKDDADITIQ